MDKKYLFIFLGILLIGSIISIGYYSINKEVSNEITNYAETYSTNLNNAQISPQSNSDAQWTVIKSTGWENDNFKVWFSNLKDKKTQICLVPRNDVTLASTPTLTIYNKDGTPILDDKDKTITLKYESSKCDGKDGYTITLTDAQAININDYIKFGEHSIVIEYQNISRVNYQGDWFDLNATLYIDFDGKFDNKQHLCL